MTKKEKEKIKGKVIKEVDFGEPEGLPSEKKEDDGMIKISKEALVELKSVVDQLKKDNELLFQIADKRQMARLQAQRRAKMPDYINLRQLNGKIVVGWAMSEDKVEYDSARKVWLESQKVLVIYEDGTKEEMYLREFELKHTKVRCQKIGEVIDNSGRKAFKLVRLDNGKEYTIDETFVN